MYDYFIYSRLNNYEGAKKYFHVPGHKARGEFAKKFPVAKLDVTELPYSDNLLAPDEVIARAQNDIAKILGAKKSYITTDGSSSGVLAMLYCAAQRGNKIIVMRNSHRSVWNGCRLFGLEPLVVQGEEVNGVLLPPDVNLVEKLIISDRNIAGFLATSPDYYGDVLPLELYADVTKKYNRLLLVDGAHGAHLAFGDKNGSRGLYAGEYADMWVDGAHKTLPALTQGAIVNVNNESILPYAETAMSIFRTTSPSYPIMASVEFGVKYLANHPDRLAQTIAAVEEFKNSVAADFTIRRTNDWTKLAIDFKPMGISPDEVAKRLEKKGIYPEFSDGRYILFYLSPMTREEDLKLLNKQLIKILDGKKLSGTYRDRPPMPAGERTYSFQYALKKESELIPLEKAVGRMCAESAGITPPCIPVVVTGEMITAQAVAVLQKAAHNFGIYDGKIKVVKR